MSKSYQINLLPRPIRNSPIWSHCLHEYFVNMFFASFQLDSLIGRNDISEDVEALRLSAAKNCRRAELMKLYLDHVLQSDVDPAIRKSVCGKVSIKFFWIAFKEMNFTSGAKSFNAILKAVEKSCREAGQVFNNCKGVQECIVCKEEFKEPVILPCGHIGCLRCLKDHFDQERRNCPATGCKAVLPEDFKFESGFDVVEAVEKHSLFRSKLSQFFLDMLQRFVFVPEYPPHQDIVDTLLSFIVTKDLPKDEDNKRTRNLSPFRGDYIDPKPVIRSFVLQLLFRYDIETIEIHLDKFLKDKKPLVNDDDQFLEVCIMIVHCLEDSLLAEERKSSKGRSQQIDSALKHMRTGRREADDENNNLVKSLWNTALDRLAMNTVAAAINGLVTQEVKQAAVDELLHEAVGHVKEHQEEASLKKYIVRCIASKHQREAIAEWKKKELFLELLPETLRLSDADDAPDMFLLTGDRYRKVRKTLNIAWLNSDYENLDTLATNLKDERIIWRLAFHHLTWVKPCQLNNRAAFEDFLERHKWLGQIWSKNEKALCPSLANKTHRHASINNLLAHFLAVLFEQKVAEFLGIFYQLSTDPINCANKFWPTMPHDETLEIKRAMESVETKHSLNPDGTLSWVKCPNGHAYAIGECGRPTHESKCVTCKAPIGGSSYNVFAGTGLTLNQTARASMEDETKNGHILGPAVAGTRSTAERDISGHDVAVIRFFLHLSMLAGCQVIDEDVRELIDPRLKQDEDVGEFLANHLLLNLRQISDCLGKSENDVIILLHQIIQSFSLDNKSSGNLASKTTVKPWEVQFVQQYIQPALTSLDEDIRRLEVTMTEDADDVTNELNDILKEKKSSFQPGMKIESLQQFWFPRDNITIDRIESKVGGILELKKKCPFLAHLLKEEQALAEVVHLPKLVELSKFLIQKFNRQIEATDADKLTIVKFINQFMDADERKFVEPLIQLFLNLLIKLKQNIFNFNQ